MSLIASAASAASATVNLFAHGHKKGSHGADSSAGASAQGTSTTQGLLSSLFETLEQIAGISVTSSATAAKAGTAPDKAQEIHGFLHALFHALKADGLDHDAASTAANSTGTTSATASASGNAAGQYQGSLVSSLQTLIQQVEGTGTANAATANLTASFNNLVPGASASNAAAASATPQVSLQNFLSNLLQNVQSSATHSLSAVGGNVNANV